MIKILRPINIEPILTEYRKLESQIQWTNSGSKGKQAGLQYKNNDDPWTSAVGRSKGNELTYEALNPFFTNTIFEEIILEYKLKKTRLMWLEKKSCYSMHRDETPRLHIPLITNTQCFFVFKSGTVEYLPTGNIYWVNTKEAHTFINCSEFPRLHLVGAVES